MKSTGNDVIDLSKINPERTVDRRFYSKFLQPGELLEYQAIPVHFEFLQFIWLLWSVKEAAYKYQKRLKPELIFSPVNIIVMGLGLIKQTAGNNLSQPAAYFCGQVFISNSQLFFQAEVNKLCISSVVNNNKDFSDVRSGVRFIDDSSYKNQSSAVRELVFAKLGSSMAGAIKLAKNEDGLPCALLSNQNIELPLSLAHHGNYVACSFNTAGAFLPA